MLLILALVWQKGDQPLELICPTPQTAQKKLNMHVQIRQSERIFSYLQDNFQIYVEVAVNNYHHTHSSTQQLSRSLTSYAAQSQGSVLTINIKQIQQSWGNRKRKLNFPPITHVLQLQGVSKNDYNVLCPKKMATRWQQSERHLS